jgi:hypothetical protein
MYNKKAFIEETFNNEYRKIHMEQGTRGEDVDYVHELKQGLAKNGISFINGFVSAIPWIMCTIISIIMLILYNVF